LFKQRVLNATYCSDKERKDMSEEKDMTTLGELFDNLEHAIDEVKSSVNDATNQIEEAYSSVDYAKDYINDADRNMSELDSAVEELRNRSGEFTTKKVKTELTKLIDILLKQQTKLG